MSIKTYQVIGRTEFHKLSELFNLSNRKTDVIIIESEIVPDKDSNDGKKQISSVDCTAYIVSSVPGLRKTVKL